MKIVINRCFGGYGLSHKLDTWALRTAVAE